VLAGFTGERLVLSSLVGDGGAFAVDILNLPKLIYGKFISLSQGEGAMVGHGMVIPGAWKSEPRGAGLSPAELTPGTFVTVSESKRIPDRSLVEAIWVVIAVNEAHAVLRFHCGCPAPHDPSSATRIVPLREHDFYRADHLVMALEADVEQKQSATVVRIRDC
jgi:hypothetical protein